MNQIVYILLSAFSTSLYSQEIAIDFLFYEKPYESITNGINLTEEFSELDWEEYNLNFDLTEKIYLLANDYSYEFTKINISFDSYIWLTGQNITTGEEVTYDLFPFSDILTYRYLGEDSSTNSSIVYLYRDDTSFIEFKNLTFYYENLNELSPHSKFNLIVCIDHVSGAVKFHYGESEFVPGTIQTYIKDTLNPRILIGLALIEDWRTGYPVFLLQNSPSDPDTNLFWITPDFEQSLLTGLNDLPMENIVYSFNVLPANSIDSQNKFFQPNLFPNPGHSYTRVNSGSQEQSTLKVMNLSGKIVYQNTFYDYIDLNTTEWQSGLYIFYLLNTKGVESIKWLKH